MSETVVAPRLLPQHARLLAASAISPEVAAARGYRSVEEPAALAELGFARSQRRVPALLLPIWGPDGRVRTHHVRPDAPRLNDRGKAVKYETPLGSAMALDVPPAARPWLEDPSRPLWITEGVRKADAAVSAGVCCVALLGVWCWRGTNPKGGKVVLGDFEQVALNGRRILLAFDSDVVEKPAVHAALKRLRAFLESRGARVVVARLAEGADGSKVGLDDYLVAAADRAEALITLARAATADLPRAPLAAPAAGDRRPTVPVGTRIGPMVAAAEDALLASRAPLYVRGGRLARVGPDGVQDVPLPSLRRVLSDEIRWTKETADGSRETLPPREVVEEFAAQGAWRLPRLEAVVATPALLPDGSVLETPGYHAASAILYRPDADYPPIPAAPSLADARVALEELHKPLSQFPFKESCDRSAALALFLTLLARPAIDGPTPLFVIRAPTQGSGKGKLAKVAGILLSGAPPPLVVCPKHEDEWAKELATHVKDGHPFVALDEASHIESPFLASAVSEGRVYKRELGANTPIRGRVPVYATCGNQTTIAKDFGRRVVPVEIDPHTEYAHRRVFKIRNLEKWVLAQRPHLVAAALTALRAYVVAGRPDQGLEPLGSFEAWSDLVRSALVWAGLADPVAGQARLVAEADVGADDAFHALHAWRLACGDVPHTAREAASLASHTPEFRDALLALTPKKDEVDHRSLGYALRKLKGKILGGLVLEASSREGVERCQAWCVSSAASGTMPEENRLSFLDRSLIVPEQVQQTQAEPSSSSDTNDTSRCRNGAGTHVGVRSNGTHYTYDEIPTTSPGPVGAQPADHRSDRSMESEVLYQPETYSGTIKERSRNDAPTIVPDGTVFDPDAGDAREPDP